MKIDNLKNRALSFGLAAVIAAGAYVVSAPTTAYATKNDVEIVWNDDSQEYEGWYTVQPGDTASKISAFLVSKFIERGEVPQEDREFFNGDQNRRCRFWPGVAKNWIDAQNEERALEALEQGKTKYKKVTKFRIHPGDRIRVAGSYEELKADNDDAKRSGWYARYVQENGIYAPMVTIKIDLDEAKRRIQEVYRYNDPTHVHEISDEEAYAYLKGIGGPNLRFVVKEGASLNGQKDAVWQFYEYLLTPEETQQIMEKTNKQKPKTKTR